MIFGWENVEKTMGEIMGNRYLGPMVSYIYIWLENYGEMMGHEMLM